MNAGVIHSNPQRANFLITPDGIVDIIDRDNHIILNEGDRTALQRVLTTRSLYPLVEHLLLSPENARLKTEQKTAIINTVKNFTVKENIFVEASGLLSDLRSSGLVIPWYYTVLLMNIKMMQSFCGKAELTFTTEVKKEAASITFKKQLARFGYH